MFIRQIQKSHKFLQYSFSSKAQSYYQVLGVSTNASQQEIYQAYVQLGSQSIQTVSSNSSEFLNQEQSNQFRNIAEAYAVLSHLESRNNYDLLSQRQPERLLKQNKDQVRQRDQTGNVIREPYAEGSYAQERQRQLAEERAKFNVDFLGRYKGGLPQKGKGPVRGSIHGAALGPAGGFHDTLVHNEKTNQFPAEQIVTNEAAQDFSVYQQQSRYETERRWPAFQAKVDYDYFKFSHYRYAWRFFRNAMVFFFGIPVFAMLFQRWRNTFALSKFKKIKQLNPDAPVVANGRQVIVGKYGAVKYAN